MVLKGPPTSRTPPWTTWALLALMSRRFVFYLFKIIFALIVVCVSLIQGPCSTFGCPVSVTTSELGNTPHPLGGHVNKWPEQCSAHRQWNLLVEHGNTSSTSLTTTPPHPEQRQCSLESNARWILNGPEWYCSSFFTASLSLFLL